MLPVTCVAVGAGTDVAVTVGSDDDVTVGSAVVSLLLYPGERSHQ